MGIRNCGLFHLEIRRINFLVLVLEKRLEGSLRSKELVEPLDFELELL
jgi:hypothetical protein